MLFFKNFKFSDIPCTIVIFALPEKWKWRGKLGSFWFSPTLISIMADQPSSTAAKKLKKKGGGIERLFRDLIKRPKPANDSASQSNPTRTSAFGAHDPVQGNYAGSAEPTASSEYIGSILVLSMTNWSLSRCQCYFESGYVLGSYVADLADLAHHTDPTTPFQSARLTSSSDPDDLLGPQGELKYTLGVSQKLTSNTSRRGQPHRQPYFDYCGPEFSKAGLGLESSYKRRSWSGFAVCANAPQEAARVYRYQSS